jgi:hypothetical protein
VRPIVHTDWRDVHAVLQSNGRERCLFLLNVGTRARTVTVAFGAIRSARLRDVNECEEIEVRNGRAEVDVDCKRARIFHLL